MKYQSEKSPVISFSYRKVLNLGTILSFFFSKCIHVIYKNRIIGGYPSVSILFFLLLLTISSLECPRRFLISHGKVSINQLDYPFPWTEIENIKT